MSFIKSFVAKHIQAAASFHPPGQEAVAVLFYGPPPTPALIAALAPDAEVSSQESGGKIRIRIAWPTASTVITIDPNWDKAMQMQGMRDWAERFPKHVRELAEVKALIESFEQVQGCYGTVSKPGFDADDKVVGLLQALLAEGGGFFFSRNSFYGADRIRITGFDEDPPWLGVPEAPPAAVAAPNATT